MRLISAAALLLLALTLSAADRDFNGRWDITMDNHPPVNAWWLQVTGAGTPDLAGRFVGFPGGDTSEIPQISIQNDILRFSNSKPGEPGHGPHEEFTARLVNGELKGSMKSESNHVEWTGVRAPVINEHDDGTWHAGDSVDLFNGRDLNGWHGLRSGADLGWSVINGALTSAGRANDLVSDAKFWNFKLHVEFRIPAQSNSGVGLRGRYEVQILDDFGKPPNLHGNGALYSRILPTANASKPPGEWQTYDIRLVGRDVTVVLNDQKVIDHKVIEGLTAIASDAHEGLPGPIQLQGDHGAVEFRRIVIAPLTH